MRLQKKMLQMPPLHKQPLMRLLQSKQQKQRLLLTH